jgi:RecA-family ATPase
LEAAGSQRELGEEIMRYRSVGLTPALPRRTLDYLQHGAREGSRNAELFDAACQFRDAGTPQAQAEERLLARAMADGLTETEARHTIQSAFASPKREPAGHGVSQAEIVRGPRSGFPARNTREQFPQPVNLPEPLEDGFRSFAMACFQPGEFVAIAPAGEGDDGAAVPKRGVTLPLEDWLARVEKKGGIDRCFTTALGLFVRINPMKKNGARNEDVASFRHVLVEFDRNEAGEAIPKEAQYGAILASGMPVSAVIDSGNKSLHAWVRIDAPDAKEYGRRIEVVWKWFEGLSLDKQNKNPSRLSRCPDGWRTVAGEKHQQRLLALHVGAKSWDEWEQLNPNDGLPDPEQGAAFMAKHEPEPPQLIRGILHQESKMAVGGTSKGRKSWSLIDMMLSVSSGTPWWGFPTSQGRVLYLNFELPRFAIQHRIRVIGEAKGISDFSNFDLWNLRGYATDFSILLPKIIQRIRERHYALIILDPIYKGLGGRDENSNADIASLLNEIERMTKQTGAAAVFGAHFSKGNQAGKEAIDRMSGAGTFARDPDVILTLTPHEEDEAYVVDLSLRALPHLPPFVVRWRGVVFEPDASADAKAVRKPGKPAKAASRAGRTTYRKGSMAERYGCAFRAMEPMEHRSPDEESPVLQHIARTVQSVGESCDIGKARRIFDALRHRSCALVVFRNERWQGAAFAHPRTPEGGSR